jgi:hypothetical protein
MDARRPNTRLGIALLCISIVSAFLWAVLLVSARLLGVL